MVTPGAPKVRLAEPDRQQPAPAPVCFDDLVPAEHPARMLWRVLGTLDLSRFADGITSVEGHAGRALHSPRMMLTLWLFAITEGIGSARKIARQTLRDAPYRWIVGDIAVSHDKLSAFRREHGVAFDALFTDVVAASVHRGLLSLDVASQDGTRTRAAASAPSFRTYGSSLQCREQAALHLRAVLTAATDDEDSRAQHARREAAAKDIQARLEAAIVTVKELQADRKADDKPTRASTTDAEARVMKMGDGGFVPRSTCSTWSRVRASAVRARWWLSTSRT